MEWFLLFLLVIFVDWKGREDVGDRHLDPKRNDTDFWK